MRAKVNSAIVLLPLEHSARSDIFHGLARLMPMYYKLYRNNTQLINTLDALLCRLVFAFVIYSLNNISFIPIPYDQ